MLFASWNSGKIREIKSLFAQYHLEIESLSQLPIKLQQDLPDFSVLETGATFQENAELKASAVARLTADWVLADDSGLEIEALNGFPGVKSARWMAGTDDQRNQAILEKMIDLPLSSRGAQFETCVCLVSPVGKVHFFTGMVKGTISHSISNQFKAGFGYDPIFIPEGYAKSFAELGANIKNTISHRARAIAQVISFLKQS